MKNFKNILLGFSFLITFISNGQILPVHLTTEMAENPLAVIQNQPGLSWQLVSKETNVSQNAYQVLVSSSQEKLKKNDGDVWNSGKVISNKNLQITYSGNPLKKE